MTYLNYFMSWPRPAPEPAPSPTLITRFVLRPLDDRLVVGPQNGVRTGVVRVLMGDQEQQFHFSPGRLETQGHGFDHTGEGDVHDEFQIPAEQVALPGIRVTYNVSACWLRVERICPGKQDIVVHVDFPGDKPLLPPARSNFPFVR